MHYSLQISLNTYIRTQTIELLSLERNTSTGGWCLQPVISIPTTLKPVTLEGDLLAMSDDIRETIIFDWKSNAYATLEQSQDEQGILQVSRWLTRWSISS